MMRASTTYTKMSDADLEAAVGAARQKARQECQSVQAMVERRNEELDEKWELCVESARAYRRHVVELSELVKAATDSDLDAYADRAARNAASAVKAPALELAKRQLHNVDAPWVPGEGTNELREMVAGWATDGLDAAKVDTSLPSLPGLPWLDDDSDTVVDRMGALQSAWPASGAHNRVLCAPRKFRWLDRTPAVSPHN